jgi:hypothetical protein
MHQTPFRNGVLVPPGHPRSCLWLKTNKVILILYCLLSSHVQQSCRHHHQLFLAFYKIYNFHWRRHKSNRNVSWCSIIGTQYHPTLNFSSPQMLFAVLFPNCLLCPLDPFPVLIPKAKCRNPDQRLSQHHPHSQPALLIRKPSPRNPFPRRFSDS